YSEYSNLVESLHITPRLIIHKKCFKPNNTYGLTLNIKNTGLFPRLIKLTTDSPEDTSITIIDMDMKRYLETDDTMEVKIWIRSSTRRDINRRRHIFIECFHPNIIFQVPIIVLDKLKDPTVSDKITFPSCVPGNKTHFEMLVFNPTKDRIRMRYRNTNFGLSVNTGDRDTLAPGDYIKVLLTIHPQKLQIYKGFFNIKFGVLPPRPVMFEFTPKSIGLHLSHGHLEFGLVKYSREEVRTVTVCNESQHEVTVEGEMYKDEKYVEFDIGHKTPSVEDENDLDSPKLSNKLVDGAVSMHSVLLFDFDDSKSEQMVYPPESSKHFDYHAPHRISAQTSSEIKIFFRPCYDLNDPTAEDQEPPYFHRTRINFCFSDAEECLETHFVIVSGDIAGVEVEVHPKVVDFRKVFLGEEHCAQIKILNVDAVPAMVTYKDCLEPEAAGIRISPVEGYRLEPCTRGVFHLSFYSLFPNRFAVTLRFKVVNGAHYKIAIRGTGQPVQLRTFPALVEFGSIPLAVPQKRYLLLLNPLAVSITLQVKATEDGEETPLVLNIRDSIDMLPITVRDPIRHLQQVHEDLRTIDSGSQPEIELTTEFPEAVSMKSYESSESIYSTDFEAEPIPQMASHLLAHLKKQKIFDKSETDKRVIQEALVGLINTKYFSGFVKHNDYIFMDWNAIPSDPREVYCDNEIIYLRPNTGRSISIVLIPNKVGYHHRSLSVRICPSMPPMGEDDEDPDHPIVKSLIRSEFLCSKLWFEYHCVAPEIEWNNMVDLSHRTIYAGEDYSFNMTFTNRSLVGAFVHFDVTPTDMSFRDGVWKFYVESNSERVAHCGVTFRSIGKCRLSGLVKIVGAPSPFPFHLLATVLPTEIRVTPKYVHRRIEVFEVHKQHFYIDNCTPTHTTLSIRLKDTEQQYLTVRGGALAPTRHSMYTTLVSMFTDPDLYQNIMFVDLQFDHVMMIPITFLVEGVPIYFVANIRHGYNFGKLYTDTREQFQECIYNHRAPVKVYNKGKRQYRLVILRLPSVAPDHPACAVQAIHSRFDFEPKTLLLDPNCEELLEVRASSYVEGPASGDFLVQVFDQKYPQRKHIIRVRVNAEFVAPNFYWLPKQVSLRSFYSYFETVFILIISRQVSFKYKRSEPLQVRPYVETPVLVNACSVDTPELTLQVTGPFKIKQLYEHTFEKEIRFSMNGLERKEIFVVLNRGALKSLFCRHIEGKITVFGLARQLKPLSLRLAILVPDVVILQPHLVLFDRGQPFDSEVNLVNQGCVPAEFKWKRLNMTEKFVGDNDDPAGVVSHLLSEILRMLEYDFSCSEESNLTKRYQECQCQFRRAEEDADLILQVLDEVVNDLDLSHRPLLFPPQDENQDDRDQSSTSLVRETIYDILNRLHIETSDQWSDASTEYCFASRYIYFHEKRGVVDSSEGDLQCQLHLPHIRQSFEMHATFELAVLGGRSQMFSITLVNLREKIRFLKESTYVGVKPWYETFETVVRVSNVTRYPLRLVLVGVKTPPPLSPKVSRPEKRLVDGFCKLMTSDIMHLDPLGWDQIRVKGILGLNESLRNSFGAVINSTDSKYFWVKGQGVMPILEVMSPLPRVPLDPEEILEEYRLLQVIYAYEIFRPITEQDEEPVVEGEEEGIHEDIRSITEEFTLLSTSDTDMSAVRQEQHDLQLFRMVSTFVMVNNNQELPHAMVLSQLLLAERYLQRLRLRPELYAVHQQVYQSYQKAHRSPGILPAAMVRTFAVQPVPCEQQGRILDLGPLAFDSIRRFEVKLHFFGPGKLIAAARTAVRIPGLFVDFNISEAKHVDKKFSFWSEKCTSLEYNKDKYRNMFERLMDAELDPKLTHAHSFDLDQMVKHQRDLTPKDRRLIEDYYNSLNPSVYPDHKHHFSLAKVFSGCLSNYSSVDISIVGFFKPEKRFYTKGQLVEDYIYIDLHMGPTLPILLRGVFNS
ncbi:hypothetical protein KR018_012407, partial [Drosophila ironensis]